MNRRRIKSFIAGVLFGLWSVNAALLCSGCGSAPAANNQSDSSAEAQAAAEAALARMDGKQPVPGQTPSAPGGPVPDAGGQTARPLERSGPKPPWLDSVGAVYNRQQYLAAVGYAGTRATAEKNAFANLAAIFGQSIQADQKVTDTYQEAVKNGVTAAWAGNTVLENTIQTSTSMDALVGAEIREVWFDNKSTWYAAAVMEKTKAIRLYTGMIQANKTMIANLVAMDQAEKHTLEGFSRYEFAAAAADMNTVYGNVLQVLDAAPPGELTSGDVYRFEAFNIARTIPVGVAVKNDRAGRIQGAFARALADLGFRSGGNDSPYIVEAEINFSEVQFPNQQNKFARYEVAANLIDVNGKTALAPYSTTGREGHLTLAEAENRALAAAERKISDEYKTLLSGYLSRLLPRK
jgi:hypothetical protein